MVQPETLNMRRQPRGAMYAEHHLWCTVDCHHKHSCDLLSPPWPLNSCPLPTSLQRAGQPLTAFVRLNLDPLRKHMEEERQRTT
jgi:hypothetical protein